MSFHFRRAALIAALSPLLLSAAGGSATATSLPSLPAVLRVGDARVTLAELQRRIDEVPRFQLESLGADEAQIRRAFAERVVARELLLAREANTRKLTETLPVKQLIDRSLVQALETAVRSSVVEQVTDQVVTSYFNEHLVEFGQTQRILLFRLLVADRAAAQKLLEKARTIKDMSEWRALVRDHSLDQATRLRGGDLGFVRPNGDTDVPRVRTTRELFEAAAKVRDGQLVPEPIAEGSLFAVVWRRGSTAAVEARLEDHQASIRRSLVEARTRQQLEALVAERAKSEVKRFDMTLLDELSLRVPADPRASASAMFTAIPSKAKPAVSAGETGLR